jgi:hypothetical protein
LDAVPPLCRAYAKGPAAVSISYAFQGHVPASGWQTRTDGGEQQMAQLVAGREKGRDVDRDDDDRTYRSYRTEAPIAYRFARAHGQRASVGLLRSALSALVTFLGPSWDGPVRRYRPEDHYMRGPGPKWREKHFVDRASAGGT